ncbi:peptide-methionine (R)-S-oxide reductase MsrB [Neorhizobium galegae]|uniref:peptide-methionine (R)-S-oxide reductase MsrB n=1 Tax=Neorhizobium galegae TaxID=399 RepID=UPI000621BFB8|nr:peptide-methionine (R)-S-oxide reductase MsrB [Neorhizobium galegae]MCQ1764194.1 peptide-methionine (R)-S-oxide reductase MsrB [Neorhizobium galegae]MCQ1846101.1 peptide-methionine (R)-S-oxide reductase MsrB [Neorhizobium galegae]CDZ35785.1 Methionine-R-sulfoxide reductase [Neorhizobium galegae bv. officinalis]
MMNRRIFLAGSALALVTAQIAAGIRPALATAGTFPVSHTEDEWRKLLTPEQYNILREEGTEYPGSSALLNEHRKGTFSCVGCDQALFSSETKFESGTGWPSFWAPLDNAVGTVRDTTLGMVRIAVNCARCGGHLGHVFDDGPKPTGLRYCMNGAVMKFRAVSA